MEVLFVSLHARKSNLLTISVTFYMFCFQAAIGIAFSVGFIIGPLIGAFFSRQARIHDDMFFRAPAMFALLLALIDVMFLVSFLRETLPIEKRVRKPFF